jgi:hypothetical protein
VYTVTGRESLDISRDGRPGFHVVFDRRKQGGPINVSPHGRNRRQPFLAGDIPATVAQNAEMCATTAAGYVAEGLGLSVYVMDGGTVYRTYVSTSRGLEPAMA